MSKPPDQDANVAVLDDLAQWWRTDISRISPGAIELSGRPIAELIERQDFTSVIWLLLRGELPSREQSLLLQSALIASAEHGPLAPAVAAARMASSCGIGINSAIASGVNMLGDIHGGAGQQCMDLLLEIDGDRLEAGPVERTVERVLRRWRERDPYVPGFGHRIHGRDPRRDPLIGGVERAVAEGVIGGRYLELGLAVEAALQRPDRAVPMNVDGCTAIIYLELGFTPDVGRGLFVIGRSVGILAHAAEERRRGTRVKGPIPTKFWNVPNAQAPGAVGAPGRRRRGEQWEQAMTVPTTAPCEDGASK